MLLQFAWRNIWRNKRRTIITVTSVAFAVFFSSMLQAIQEGSWDNMIDNVIGSYTGNVQVHKKGYWDNPSINELIDKDKTLARINLTGIAALNPVPRLESFALASTGEFTKGSFIVGIDPHAEDDMTRMASRVQLGDYLKPGDKGMLIGQGLAEALNTTIGDTVFLISQGYRGVNAVGQYPVRGILRFPSPQYNRQMILLTLPSAQALYGAEGLVNTLAFRTGDIDEQEMLVSRLKSQLDTSLYEVMPFDELMPELLKSKEVDAAGNYMIFFILYTIIGFGIFGTLLMMMRERQYEMGVLISIGMKRLQLFSMVWMELLLLGIIGALIGIVIAYGGAWYIHLNPIKLTGDLAEAMENFEFEPLMPASVHSSIFLTQGSIIFIICMVISLYPLFHILKLKPIDAMRS